MFILFFFVFLAEVVARVQALRLNQNPKDDAIIREKVCDTARLVRDVHQRYLKINYHALVWQENYIPIYFLSFSLTLLGKKSSDADKAVAMLTQCQEQILTLDDAKPLVNNKYIFSNISKFCVTNGLAL